MVDNKEPEIYAVMMRSLVQLTFVVEVGAVLQLPFMTELVIAVCNVRRRWIEN